MRRLLRWAFNLSAAVSLLLSVGVCALWQRGRVTADRLYVWHGPTRDFGGGAAASPGFEITHANGLSLVRHLVWLGRPKDLPAGRPWKHLTRPTRVMPPGLDRRLGFGPHRRTLGPFKLEWNRSEWNLYVPDYAPAFATAVLPAGWAWARLRRRRKQRHGLCPVCGYDLRATPSRCPECGHVPGKKGETPAGRAASAAAAVAEERRVTQ